MNKSTSTIEVAEKRERRVLLQMSVLVMAFLVFWLPFWTYFAVVHLCHVFYKEVLTINQQLM
jgi:hypothetical protein